MKFSIDVDCTPEEARQFLGLPDVRAMQDRLVAETGRRLMANLEAMDPETLLKTWLPGGMQGLESLQKMFWSQMSQMSQAATGAGKTKPKDPGRT